MIGLMESFLYLHNTSFKVTVLTDAFKDHIAIGFPKDSEFKDIFNYHLTILEESGILHKLRKKYFSEALPLDLNTSEKIVLGFENVVFPFLYLFLDSYVSLLFQFMKDI